MHKKTKGSIAELAVALDFTSNGWQVLFPYGENSRYDLVAEKKGHFLRIQVKYVTPKRGMLYVNCRSSNNWSVLHYTAEDIDAIAAYDSLHSEVYYVPVEKSRKSAMCLRLDATRNGQRKRIRFAKEFRQLEFRAGTQVANGITL